MNSKIDNVELIEEYIKQGKMYAELDELFKRVLKTDFYAGLTLDMNQSPITAAIKVLNPSQVMGESKFRLKQLQNMIAQRINVPSSNVEVIFEKIEDKRLCPEYYAEMIRQAFMENKPHKKIINSAFRAVDAAKGQGCSIKISGKLRGQRAKSTNYIHGVLIQAGQPAKDYIRLAKSEAMCKQGVIGIQVKIMLPYDPEGVKGPSKLLSDKIIVRQ